MLEKALLFKYLKLLLKNSLIFQEETFIMYFSS